MELPHSIKQKLKVSPQRTDILSSRQKSKGLNDGPLHDPKLNRIVASLPPQTQGNYSKDTEFLKHHKAEQQNAMVGMDDAFVPGAQQIARETDSIHRDGEQNLVNTITNRDSIFNQNSIF